MSSPATHNRVFDLPSNQPIARVSQALAGRWQRYLAAMIDGFVLAITTIPVAFLLVAYELDGMTSTIVGFLGAAMGFCIANFHLLESRGQTVGKFFMNIKIVDNSGHILPAVAVIMKRYMVFWGIGMIPVLGGIISLVNILLIFGLERKCGHDLLAGTKVVKA